MTRKKIRQLLHRDVTFHVTVSSTATKDVHMSSRLIEWSKQRDSLRKFGYALRESTPTHHRFLTRRKVNAMTPEGMEIATGSVNRDHFFYFVRGSLIPMMKPLDRHGPHSVFILDNCSVHQVREVTQLLTQEGIVVLFPPPHSPDLNPIVEAFSYVRQSLSQKA
jgi:hypothetical protein